MGGQQDLPDGVRLAGKRLRSDHAFRAELALCIETLHIPHSHFLGGPNVWTDLDREKVRAYREWKAEVCTSCGTHAAEWDPKRGGHRDAYIASLTYCQGCSRLNESREKEIDETDRARGVHQVLMPRERYEALMDQAEQEGKTRD